jgi:hypothetical protein
VRNFYGLDKTGVHEEKINLHNFQNLLAKLESVRLICVGNIAWVTRGKKYRIYIKKTFIVGQITQV